MAEGSPDVFQPWEGTWQVRRRTDHSKLLTFVGVDPKLHAEEEKASEVHRLRLDASAFTWEYRVRGADALCRGDFSGEWCPAQSSWLPFLAGDAGEAHDGAEWRHLWVEPGKRFKTEVRQLRGKPDAVVCLEWHLGAAPPELELSISVAKGDQVDVLSRCTLTRDAGRGSAGPSPVSWLRRHGRPLATAAQRMEALERAMAMISDNIDAISAAQEQDRVFPSRFNGVAQMLIGGTKMYMGLVEQWTAPEKLADTCPSPMRAGVEAEWFVVNEPKGVCINVSPWNAPVQLSVIPMLGMLAAGNHCVIKPPELVPNVSALLRKLCQRYLDGFVWVEEGGREAVERLIDEGADHLVFTGGGEIAKVVAARCARYLTPMTLELGGKSPVFFDKSLEGGMLDDAIREILELKVHKTGQFCCAHDYALVHAGIWDRFCEKFEAAVKALGERRHVALIGKRQYEDLKDKIAEVTSEKVVCIPPMEGSFVPNDDAMTIPFAGFLEPSLSCRLLTSEIFAPALPIVKVADHNEAIAVITNMVTGKPLIAYCYALDEQVVEAFVHRTSSGNVAINSGPQRMLMNFNCAFGGIGPSGMGASMWGRDAMREFSNRKHVIHAKGGFAKSFFSGPPPPPSS